MCYSIYPTICPGCGSALYDTDAEELDIRKCPNGCGTQTEGNWRNHEHVDICGYFDCKEVENNYGECIASLFAEQPDCCYPK